MSEVEKRDAIPNDLVVVGSSAGGVEALSVLVSTLALDFPAPIVIAQHLDPNRQSTLDLILQHRTKLPVELVTQISRLRSGSIYVVPANHHVVIKDHQVEIQENRLKRPRPSVDTLLSTAALAFGDHLIAVILTGSGSDGAVGAVDVKNAGGTVIVQDPQTARYPSMPLALPPTIVDFEAPIEQIGPLLYDLLRGVSIPPTEERTEDVLRDILEQVSRQASVDFRPYKTSTILRRIGRRMTVTHCRTMRDYADYLVQYPEEVGELVKAFLINVTQFFRDAEAFSYLRSEILPKLIAKARERDRLLRFWTAGCATGEEPYSLAMLLTDLLGSELPEWSVKIFATDLDEAAIDFARRGLYSENLLKGIPAEYRDRFFERVDHGYRISKTLRQMVIFGQQDLSRSAPFPRIDLVLCRNVLIYFTLELQDYVLNQFAFSLSPDGYLFLGKAETVRPMQSFYELVNKQWKVYRCTGSALPSVRHKAHSESSTPSWGRHVMNRPNRNLGEQTAVQESSAPSFEIGQLRRFNESLLPFLPIGVVVIDRSYRILTANALARRLLGLRDTPDELDFLHAVRGIPYHQTRSAIDQLFRERRPITLPEVEMDVSGGNGRFISLAFTLMQIEAGSPDLATISVTEITEQIQMRRQLEAIQTEQTHLVNELGTANKRLSDVNKELMDANEELQVSNEELVLTHEELQASIEEFETTNEELQATNEELETNNEELQATNEELETTNDELRARTSELQELTSILESERLRLNEIVELAPFYILVLRGASLIVEAFSPRYAHLLGGHAVQGRPLEEVLDLFWEAGTGGNIIRLAREVYRQEIGHTVPRMLTYLPGTASKGVESYFAYTIVPSHDANERVDGVIIYALDETEQHARAIQDELERLRLIFENMSSAILGLYDARTATLILGSPRYLEIISRVLPPQHLIGGTWHTLNIVPSGEEAIQLWNRVLQERTPVRVSEVRYKPSPDAAEETFWDYTLTPIMDREQTNTARFVLVSAIEITDQVKARKELERLDALKDDFLSMTTHELRTPLTTILGNAQLLQRTLERQATNNEHSQIQSQPIQQSLVPLQRITQKVTQMNKLISEIFDVTRMRAEMFELHKRENVDIVALIQQVVEQSRTENYKIVLYGQEKSIPVAIDDERIEQVLSNLLTNAMKHGQAGKPIQVTVECDKEHSHEVIVAIHNEGDSIPQEEQAHIFDRFYRVRNNDGHAPAGGLGLGLYIAREIVLKHGGRMWLSSKDGEGSTFFFSLPIG